jgi:CDP-glucose 4,6-dehydratase
LPLVPIELHEEADGFGVFRAIERDLHGAKPSFHQDESIKVGVRIVPGTGINPTRANVQESRPRDHTRSTAGESVNESRHPSGRIRHAESDMIEHAFWRDRRVLLTGHTCFKGAWLSLWLEQIGAQVFGLALPPDTEPALYSLLQPFARLHARLADIRDPAAVAAAVDEARPQIVIHMAAQSLVRRAYRQPVDTFATNVMGTAHLLEAVRGVGGLQAVLVITTDKVYRNDGQGRPFTEDDPLGGADPYSASKAAAEFVVASMARSFFAAEGVAVATARAGNVIGGGDWAEDRLIPDVWRAVRAGAPLPLRYPQATRPWQHVLEPLSGYLIYAERLASGAAVPPALNFGPKPDEVLTVAEVAEAMLKAMQSPQGWVRAGGANPKEADTLAIDPSLAMRTLGWRPRLGPAQSVQWTADWYRAVNDGADPRRAAVEQIRRYEALA